MHKRLVALSALEAKPSRQWVLVYAVLLVFFMAFRSTGLASMLDKYANQDERSFTTTAPIFILGTVEDFALATILLVVLSLVDFVFGPHSAWAAVVQRLQMRLPTRKGAYELAKKTDEAPPSFPSRRFHIVSRVLGSSRRLIRLSLHFGLILLAMAPSVMDVSLHRIRGMRFTFEIVRTYLREIKFTDDVRVASREAAFAAMNAKITLTVALILAFVTTSSCDFTRWHLARLLESSPISLELKRTSDSIEDGQASPWIGEAPAWSTELFDEPSTEPTHWKRKIRAIGVPIAICLIAVKILLVVSHAVPAVVSSSALNSSLNELVRLTTHQEFLKGLGDGTLASASEYIDPTEECELFHENVLFRKTTGFHGPLAFDVQVDHRDPPNVLVVAVESFRYQDSLYIVGNKAEALLKKNKNVSLAPEFDRWAKRGVAFRNMWSSWPSSRSLESILFAQVPYDAVVTTGPTGGRLDVELHGMPQLFKQKGYETVFTTGSTIKYDQWDQFLPSHGFDDVVPYSQFSAWAMSSRNRTAEDTEERKQGLKWGIHDDLAFEVLADLLLNKTWDQKQRVANGEPKNPFFLMHYTISSHQPFTEEPSWFANISLPELEPLYKGEKNWEDIKRYARLRRFTDGELGKFFDRLKADGVLNDTIVVVVGDHGTSPEIGLPWVWVDEVATTRVPAMILAEGRLGGSAGMIVDDATQHYDLLNTLADIVGVPEGGFLQSGVGRSLKRALAPEERVVWTNNPTQTLAVVKGHRRMRYKQILSAMAVFDAEADPKQWKDLYPTLSTAEKSEWKELRERGRRLSRYFTLRWDNKCISRVDCGR